VTNNQPQAGLQLTLRLLEGLVPNGPTDPIAYYLDAEPAPAKAWLGSHGHTARLIQGSVYELPYKPEEFDLVLSLSVFEHLHQ
jgi:hypothetical protein